MEYSGWDPPRRGHGGGSRSQPRNIYEQFRVIVRMMYSPKGRLSLRQFIAAWELKVQELEQATGVGLAAPIKSAMFADALPREWRPLMLRWLGARPFVPFPELAGRLVLEDDNAQERQERARNQPLDMGVAPFYPLPFEDYRERNVQEVGGGEAHGLRRERMQGRQEDRRNFQPRTPFQRSHSVYRIRRSPSRGRPALSHGAAYRYDRAVRSRSSARREQPVFDFPPQKRQRGLSFERYLGSRP